ncbi:MAG: polysaccharide pyruvyl transferase family protein [Planctomycetia bacterium]|nr:polysaccharide pyruvyl transferase family protein [Planctomycetia bacterium]
MKIAIITNGPDEIRGCQGLRMAWERMLRVRYGSEIEIYNVPHWEKEAPSDTNLVVSTGGDSLGFGGIYLRQLENSLARKIPTVVGGFSVSLYQNYGCEIPALESLRKVTAISVRDRASQKILQAHGISSVYHLDPAYILRPESVFIPELNAFFARAKGNVIGVNLQHVRESETIEWQIFLQYLLHKFHVLLIPGDIPIEKRVWERLRIQHERLFHVPTTLTYPQLKSVVAQCRALISLSSHIAMAGYHTAVPTLAVAYSLKAQSLAADLFPDGNHWCVKNADIHRADFLQTLFLQLLCDAPSIRDTLQSIPFTTDAWKNSEILP